MKNYYKKISLVLSVLVTFMSFPVKATAKEAINSKVAGTEATKKVEESKKEGKIVKEIIEKRDSNVKYFLKDDSTYEVAVYPSPIHYLENGKWKDIDNTMTDKKDEKSNEVLENKDNDFKVKFAKNSNANNIVQIKKDKYSISWGLENSQKSTADNVKQDEKKVNEVMNQKVDYDIKTSKKFANDSEQKKNENKNILLENEKTKSATKSLSIVNYNNILKGVNLQYELKGDQLKENIIIQDKIDKPAFTFNLKLDNLTPKLEEDNSISFSSDKDGKNIVFNTMAPFMYDAKGNTSKDVKLSIIKDNDKYKLVIEPDSKWLNSKDRAYPVTVDPQVKTQQDRKLIQDTFVCTNDNSDKSENFYDRVGYHNVVGATRSFIKFPLPILQTGDMVIGAQLSLFKYKLEYSKGLQVNVHKVNSSWNAYGLTWSTQPSYNPIIEDYKSIGNDSTQWYGFDITGMVKDWYSTSVNNGLMLKANDESANTDNVAFASSAIASSDEASQIYSNPADAMPYVTMEYINTTGIEGYWNYSTQSLDRSGTAYVNNYCGNLIYEHNDLSMTGNRMPISLNHYYNSNDKNNDIGFGLGWRTNFSQRISQPVPMADGNYYIYTDEDGTKHYFKIDSTNIYKDESGLDLKLVKNSDNTFTIEDKKNNKLQFTAGGILYLIQDTNKNSIGIESDGNGYINKLADGVNRIVTVTSDSNHHVRAVKDTSSGKEIKFDYTGNQLTSITYPDLKVTRLTYDANNNLDTITGIDGGATKLEYYPVNPFRVKSVLEKATDGANGNQLNFEYGNNTTRITDLRNKKNLLQFNNLGNLVCIVNDDNSAQYYKYINNSVKDKDNNKIDQESKLQKTVVNYLNNHNAEMNSSWSAENWSGSTGTATYTNEKIYMGSQSLKVFKTNNVSRTNFSQKIKLEKGKTYTFSGYVKTYHVTQTKTSEAPTGKGAALFIMYQDSAGNWKTVDSKYINGTNEWDRSEVTFTLPADAASNSIYAEASIVEESGTAYFDCFQLEEGNAANRYNLVDDGSFTSGTSDFWKTNNFTESVNDKVTVNEDKLHPVELDNNIYKITGETSKNKAIYQSIKVSGKKNDAFVLGGWARADSVPLTQGLGRYFALDIGFKKADGSIAWHPIQFNTGSKTWQYMSDVVLADDDYVEVEYYVIYYANCNTAYFDGLSLYKELFGTSYTYDSNNNVSTVANVAKQNSQFKYSDKNDLISSIDPKGGKFKYSYDTKHNMLDATTAENNFYSFSYDSYGNPTNATINNGSTKITSSAKYTTNGDYLYQIIDSMGVSSFYNYNTSTGLLDSATDNNNNTKNYEYNSANNTLKNAYTSASGIKSINSYTYNNDKIDTIRHNTSSNDVAYKFCYDNFGRNQGVDLIEGGATKNLITNYYKDNNTSLINHSTYGNGNIIGYSYDEHDRIIEKNSKTNKDSKGNTEFKYTYDANGNLAILLDYINGTDMSNPLKYKYTYDNSDRLVKVSDSKGSSTSYTYDMNNNIKDITDLIPGYNFITNYGYDKDNRNVSTYYSRPNIYDTNTESFMLNGSTIGSKGTKPINESSKFEADENGKLVLDAYDATSNLLTTNTSFENGLTGWKTEDWQGTSGKGAVINGGVDGGSCLVFYDENRGTNSVYPVAYQYATLPAAITSPQSYTLSAFAEKLGSINPTLRVQCLDANGNSIIGGTFEEDQSISPYRWTRISKSFMAPAGTKSIMVIVRAHVKGNDFVRFDNVQLEGKKVATAYASDLQSGSNSYDGTKLIYDLSINKYYGTLYTWFKTKISDTDRYIFTTEGSNSEVFDMYIGTDNKIKVAVKSNSGEWTTVVGSSDVVDVNKWNMAGISWQPSGNNLSVTLYVNDKKYTGLVSNFKDFTACTTAIGSTQSGKAPLYGQIDQFAYSQDALDLSNIYSLGRGNAEIKGYDEIGRLATKEINTGSKSYLTTYSYKNNIQAGSTTNLVDSITNGNDKLSYKYDSNGNITSIVQSGKEINYSYNELNELKREDNPILKKTIKYEYDAGGNLLKKLEYQYTTSDTGNPTKSISYQYNDPNWKDKLSSYDGKSIDYDDIGNPLNYDNYKFSWEKGRQLKSIVGNGKSLEFKYNDAGIRTEKKHNGVVTKYNLIGDKVTYEDNGLDKIYYTYNSSARLVSMNLNGVEYYYIRNVQGDIIGLFDKSGTQVVSYTYDTWGKLIAIDGSLKDSVGIKNPYRYRGYRYDSETGLYYLQNRYYNPEWGRFINADAIAGQVGELLGHNLFSYCKNNPVNMSDKSGFRPIFSVGDETDEMYEASIATMARAARNNASNSNITRTNKILKSIKNTAKDAVPGLSCSTLYSAGENLGKFITIGKSITKINRKIVGVSPVTLGIFKNSFKRLGVISLGQSVWDNRKYGIGLGLLRSAIDVGGFIGTAALVGTFATSGGLAAVGIGLAVGVGVEVGKWMVTDGVKYILKKE